MVSKKSKSGEFGYPSSSASQKLAVESLRNIANVNITGDGTLTGDATLVDAELLTIVEHLRGAPRSVAELAKLLQWDSTKTAKALARGGSSGLLTFSKSGDTTTVALSTKAPIN